MDGPLATLAPILIGPCWHGYGPAVDSRRRFRADLFDDSRAGWPDGWQLYFAARFFGRKFAKMHMGSMQQPLQGWNSLPRRALIRGLAVAALAAMVLLPTGCVRRRLFVQSNPPGAMVFVDNQQIGNTPCSVDFTYYGTREIRLVKPGFETLTVNQPIPTPWYEVPPVDFVSENLVPSRLVDHRTVAFNLQPQVIVPTDQLLDRANQLRQDTLQGTVVPVAAVGVPGAAPDGMLIPGTIPPPAGAAGAVPIGSPYPIPLPPTGLSTGPTFAPSAVPTPTPAAPQLGPPIVSPPLR
jgi:hypothetical protein